ncbi:gram-positive cocci surface protein, partial [Reticulomyxa filosa]
KLMVSPQSTSTTTSTSSTKATETKKEKNPFILTTTDNNTNATAKQEGTDTSSKRTTSSSPLIATDEDLKRDPANPFNMNQIFGDFSRAAQMLLNKSGQGNMEDLKKTIPPFDWSLINPSVFGGKFEDISTEDRSYFSGQKRKEWDAEQTNLTTSASASTSTSMSSDASATSSLRPGSTAPKLSKREREEMNAKMGTSAENAMSYIKPTNDGTTTSGPH